ncbi:MAG TPA: hypothetical protein VHY84_07245 [Bryobacteraceae bacterium]|nr:hypothetical protein [Bryobacteraceae bacterium]
MSAIPPTSCAVTAKPESDAADSDTNGTIRATVAIADHENGLVTAGLTPELDETCRTVHQTFLAARHLTWWQLIILQIFGTPHILIFSGASGHDEAPDYVLADALSLATRVGEILASHHEQVCRQITPASSS